VIKKRAITTKGIRRIVISLSVRDIMAKAIRNTTTKISRTTDNKRPETKSFIICFINITPVINGVYPFFA